ncbi:hypothetical protein ASPVEDRAFT_37415 [Aspergillus versicolor CBS 583.65]|uniref:Heterokaryon incompatibility domain-containing protein n=1 Tax=Aspergillus versicolor CBS 583.65 TaxID=1036611 RepID=A0A1L9P8V5_ASPVE|nr:uncharacterized protein ASPVEDRAFT_37415 [Aspergillus versicolor CBS 583.65]OJI97959.1 hypothetical protein ASPVEDRAFT_37415 [Aspergillus versicolor CBS 583.65]
MSRLLALTINFDASDPRDQIFGLITLLDEASDERNDFRPNYMLPTRWLYIQVAQRFLVQSQKLEIITAHAAPPDYQMHKIRRWKQDLPSWVPDWTIHSLWQLNSIWISSFSPYNALFPFMHHSRDSEDVIKPASSSTTTSPSTEQAGQVYNASLHDISPFPLEFSTDGGILRVCGVPFDTIEVVGSSWDIGRTMSQSFDTTTGVLNLEHNNKIQLSIVNQWKEIARLDDPGTYPFSPHSRREAFWRTLLLDRVRSMREPLYIRRIPSEPTEETLSEVIWGPGVDCGFPPESQSDEDFLIFYVRKEGAEWWAFGNINLHCVNLVFFRTAKGSIGVGHPNIQPGDQIAVLLGAPVPIVLRQYEEGHIVIGQSYVHGIMDGEVIEMERECGRGRKKEDFQVYDLI